jgi:hypothetical protein
MYFILNVRVETQAIPFLTYAPDDGPKKGPKHCDKITKPFKDKFS